MDPAMCVRLSVAVFLGDVQPDDSGYCCATIGTVLPFLGNFFEKVVTYVIVRTLLRNKDVGPR